MSTTEPGPAPPVRRAARHFTKTPSTFCSKCSSLLRDSMPMATTSPPAVAPMLHTVVISPLT